MRRCFENKINEAREIYGINWIKKNKRNENQEFAYQTRRSWNPGHHFMDVTKDIEYHCFSSERFKDLYKIEEWRVTIQFCEDWYSDSGGHQGGGKVLLAPKMLGRTKTFCFKLFKLKQWICPPIFGKCPPIYSDHCS